MTESPSTTVLNELAVILKDFHGRQYSGPIGRGTRFFGDLGLASIDAVVLGEDLDRHFGVNLPFTDLMTELGSREDRDLEIGELADFVATHLVGRHPSWI